MTENKSCMIRTAEFGHGEQLLTLKAVGENFSKIKLASYCDPPSTKRKTYVKKSEQKRFFSFDVTPSVHEDNRLRVFSRGSFSPITNRNFREEKEHADSFSTQDHSTSQLHFLKVSSRRIHRPASKSPSFSRHNFGELSFSRMDKVPLIIPLNKPQQSFKLLEPKYSSSQVVSQLPNLKEVKSIISAYSKQSLVRIKPKNNELSKKVIEKVKKRPEIVQKPSQLHLPPVPSRLARQEAWVMKNLFGQG